MAEQPYLAVVTGVLGAQGESLTICLISRDGRRVVPRTHCVLVLPTVVRSGLVGFKAHHQAFGHGVVIAEEIIDGLLHVALDRDGKHSGMRPITDITFTCS